MQRGQVTRGGRSEARTDLDGVRSAMYGEMAAWAVGDRPRRDGETQWDAAQFGAIRFVATGGFDEPTCGALLEEAAATRRAGDGGLVGSSAADLCARLAAEFRWRVRRPR